jgi:hypothetical protein
MRNVEISSKPMRNVEGRSKLMRNVEALFEPNDDEEQHDDEDISGMQVLPPDGCPSLNYDFDPAEESLAA